MADKLEPIRRQRTRTIGYFTPREKVQGPANKPTMSLPRIDRTPDSLVVRFHDPNAPSGIQSLNLTAWLARVGLATVIADYLLDWGKRSERSTRKRKKDAFNFFRLYLDDRDKLGSLSVDNLEDITTDVADGYQKWLDSSNANSPLKKLTKKIRYSAVVGFIEWCRLHPRYSNQVAEGLRFIPNAWPIAYRDVTPRPCIPLQDFEAIRRACLREARATLIELEFGKRVIADISVAVPPAHLKSAGPYKDLGTCIKAIITAFPDSAPSKDEVALKLPGLFLALKYSYQTLGRIFRHLNFTPRTILPFALLLGSNSFFNATPLLELTRNEIKKFRGLFGDRWSVRPFKTKAGSIHPRSFAANVNQEGSPAWVLDQLEKHTILARPLVPVAFRDRVFIFLKSSPTEPFSSFDNPDGPSADRTWRKALTNFIKENKLQPFGLANFRPTGSEMVNVLTDGDIQAQQRILGHANVGMVERHYQSDAARRRRGEKLAEGMSWPERYVRSGGRADTRGRMLREGRNSAATPGFWCLEPLFSPQPGQSEGRMCSAYGACPNCPLAAIDYLSPHTLVRIRQLRTQIIDAQFKVDPLRWVAVWRPQLLAIDKTWLPKTVCSRGEGGSPSP